MKIIQIPLTLIGLLSGSATAQVSVSYFTTGRVGDGVDAGGYFISSAYGDEWGHIPYFQSVPSALTTTNTSFQISSEGYTYELRGGGSLSSSDARNAGGQQTGRPEYFGDGFDLTGEEINGGGPVLITTIDPTVFTDPTVVIGNLPVGATVSFSMLAVPDNFTLSSSNFVIGDALLGPTGDASFQTPCLTVPESGELLFPLFGESGDPEEEFDYYFEAARIEVCSLPVPEPSSALLIGLSILGFTARRKR